MTKSARFAYIAIFTWTLTGLFSSVTGNVAQAEPYATPETGVFQPTPSKEISGSNTLMNYPSTSLATASNGDIWWADWNADKVYLFSKESIGDAAPLKVISLRPSPLTEADASSIAVGPNGFLYVEDATNPNPGKIYIFNPSLRDNQTISDAIAIITHPRRARGITVDSNGKIYIVGKSATGNKLEVTVYASGLTGEGSPSPILTFIDSDITVADTYGIAVASNGDILVVSNLTQSVRIYDSSGHLLRSISGIKTRFGMGDSCTLGGAKYDRDGRIYIAKMWCDDWEILIFASTASGNEAPLAVISGAAGSDLVGFTIGINSKLWLSSGAPSIREISNAFTISSNSPAEIDLALNAKIAAAAAVKAAEQAHARAVEVAKAEIKSALSSGKPLTADQLLKADISGVTTKNIELVNADIAKLPESGKTDLKQIEKVVLKFATVDKVAEGKAFYFSDLIAVGLIPQDSKTRSSITSALKKLPPSSLNSFEKIQAAVAAVEKQAADRKARLAAILGKNR